MYSKLFFNALYSVTTRFVLGIASGALLFEHGLDSVYRYFAMAFYDSAGLVRRLSYGDINAYVLTLSVAVVAIFALVYLVR